MKGNIYTRQKCFVCGSKLIHDERRGGCFCKKHPEVAATGSFYLKFGKDVRRENNDYSVLARELIGLRYKVDQNDFDPRDYQANKPMAFSKLMAEYLEEKEAQNLKSFRNIKNYGTCAAAFFDESNIKTLSKPDFKRYLKSLGKISDKTKENYLTTLRDFYTWMVDEEILFKHQIPDFPKITYELQYRKLTNWETQQAILDKIYELTWHKNPKTWLAIDMLRTYVNIRPGDIKKLEEADIDTDSGVILVWRPTKRKNERKSIRLIPDHIEIIKELKEKYPAVGPVKFFRHHSGLHAGEGFGVNMLYKTWKRACTKLGITGLDLYGGTRHTTTTEIAKRHGREAAREANENRTNKAFDRYCQMQGERAFEIARMIPRGDAKVIRITKDGTNEK